jgi:outer membrane protein assembly factor BamA
MLLVVAVLPRLAQADDPSRELRGKRVVDVLFDAPRSVRTDDLRYLVEQAVGEPWDPQAVRRSIELLYRLGNFDAVSARARPHGDGVDLIFALDASERNVGVRLRSVPFGLQQPLRATLPRVASDPFAPGDEARNALAATSFLRQRGWLDAEVSGSTRQAPRGRLIVLHARPGPRYRVADWRFVPEETAPLPADTLRAMVGPALQPGAPYREIALSPSIERLLTGLRRRGFVEARLLPLLSPDGRPRAPVEAVLDRDRHTVLLRAPLDAGRLVETRFVFTSSRPSGLPDGRLRRAIGLDAASRVTPAYAEEAARLLRREVQNAGRFHATVGAAVEDVPVTRTGSVRAASMRRVTFTIDAGPELRFFARDLTVHGAASLGARKLLSVLSDGSPRALGHRPDVFVVLGFDVYRRWYTDDEMAAALAVLRDFYRARGHQHTKIAASVRLSSDDCRVDAGAAWNPEVRPANDEVRGRDASSRPGRRVCITLDVDEGPRTDIAAIDTDGRAPTLDGLLPGWRRRHVGKPFDPKVQDALRREAVDALADDGRPDVRIAVERLDLDEGRSVRLLVRAEPGEPVRFGNVIVRDNRHTDVGWIRRQVPVHPGDPYRATALTQGRTRLLRSGLFDGVAVRTAQTIGRLRDIEVRVDERKRFGFVGGAGVTAPDDGPRVSGEVRLRNLDGRGLSVFARGRLNLDWRQIAAGSPLPEYRASLGLELPDLTGLPVHFALNGVLNEELDEPTYRIARSSLLAAASLRAGDVFHLDLRGEGQLRAPLRVDPAAQLNESTDVPRERPRAHPQGLLLLGLSALLDLRDDRFNPTKGVYVAADVDTTPGALIPGAPAFGRLTGRIVGVVPLGPIGLQVEGGAGLLWSYDSALPPVEWRFRLGGTSTVRGYRLDAIGPSGQRPAVLEEVGVLPTGSGPERSVSVGGTAYWRYSGTLLLPIPGFDQWRLVLFGDGGNALLRGVAPAGVDDGKEPAIHVAFGIGLRRMTPIGPLRLEVAFRPDGLARIATAPADALQVHFAVGAL